MEATSDFFNHFNATEPSKMDKPEPDYYLDLGISRSASASQVRKAYHLLAKIHHPDKKAPGENIDAAEFRKVSYG